ncbi:hypothetical protein Tco_0960018 [Tanacetum coccineum]
MFKTTKETKADIKETILIRIKTVEAISTKTVKTIKESFIKPHHTNHQQIQALPSTSQIQSVSKMDFESYAKANDANMNNLQMKLDNFQRNQNDFQRSYNDSQKKQNDFQNMMLGFMQNYHNNSTASTSRSGTLPSQTVTNPREHVNAITTRSGKTCEGPSTPLVPTPVLSIPSKEPEQNPETLTEKVQNPNLENTAHVLPPEEEDSIFIEIPKPKAKKTVNVEIQDLNSPRPTSYQSKLPYPERMKIGLKDALVEMPKFNKWLSLFLRNKEKLEEIAITTVNAECSAIIMNNVPRRTRSGKYLYSVCFYMSLMGTMKTSVIWGVRDMKLTFLKKDVQEGNFQDHSNPLFEFDDNFKSSTINPLFNKMDEEVVTVNSNISDSDESVLLNTPLSNKVECFTPEDDIDEIDAFLAIEVSSKFEEGYFDSEEDVTFLDNLLSNDTTHNLASEVISDHEPEQSKSSITFSPKSDPLHHEFAREVITLPSRNDLIESLPVSPIPVEDSDPVQEEINIFRVLDDLIPPSVKNDDSEGEDNELPKQKGGVPVLNLRPLACMPYVLAISPGGTNQ